MVPEGWIAGQLSDVCRLQNGYGFTPPVWDTHGLPIIRIQNLNGSQNFNYYSGEPNPKWLVEPGQMLFAWAGSKGASFGPTIWRGETGVLNQHIFKVFEADGVDHSWLFLIMRQITDRIEAKAHGFKTTLVHVKKSDIENQPIHIPPLPEQRKIAEILSTWDQAIEKTESLLANARTQKRALMQNLLTGKRRFPEFEGQPWKEVLLGDVADIDTKSLGSKTPSDFEFDYISLSNVEPGRIVGDLETHKFGDAPSRARRVLKEGDLLVSTVRPNLMGFSRVIGRFADCIASTGFSVVSPHTSESASFLFHYLFSHHIKGQIHALVVGSNYPAINSTDVKKLKINIPSREEQVKIGNILDACDVECDELSDELIKLRTEKKALMQQLLTGKRRVVV